MALRRSALDRLLVAALAGCAVASCSGGSSGGPRTPSHDSQAKLLDPTTCQTCHTAHYADWSGSMHAYASDDPVFLAMNARGQRETGGALGSFCVQCHAPMALRMGATKDGTNLAAVDASLKGVTCFFCHSTSAVNGANDDPLVLATDLSMRGPLTDAVPNTAHASKYSALLDRTIIDSATLCGACHDIVNGHGADIERTFAEWQASVFSMPPVGETCGECHMAESTNLQTIANTPNAPATRRYHSHSFPAVDTALTTFPAQDVLTHENASFLATTLQTGLCVGQQGTSFTLRALVENVAAGHDFPSGSAQDRRLWIEVIASQAGKVVYQSGVVPAGTSPTTNADADMWLLRDCMFDATGAPVDMFWNAVTTQGNELPGQATFDMTDPRFYQTHIEQTYPRATASAAGVPDTVTMRVLLQPMGLDVLDDLVSTGDLDMATRNAMATVQLGDTLTWTTATATDKLVENNQPFACITTTNFNVQADKVPAPTHASCSP